ncbi:glycosyltransferase family 2 protein [Lacinutrix neustonica]|uniref:Glycosyltransferase family 2 protein n=1 Tax=Lacinutrix neustonica TaxID=2980107 RepID=A0A9E8MX76_9FLAO|nr:glycosyltransferase family 2 protein [Lacinutrix neustonica]WAC01935.1 glycosyltransferase family 2 protein [Lacinutrix neustonica]
MLISIITINYNDVVGLERTITSVKQQDFEDFEHIIIDGNSYDGSKSIIEKYKNHIGYSISEPDGGIYHAMNKGIDRAQGDYVLFLNSGDALYDPTVLKACAGHLSTTSIVFGNLVKVDMQGETTIDYGHRNAKLTLKTFFFSTINHPSTFIKRTLFQQYGVYDEDLKIVADWKFFLIVLGLNANTYKYINILVSTFYMDGISNSNLELRQAERDSVLKALIPLPIYEDYIQFNTDSQWLTSNRFKMLLELEQYTVPKKIMSLVLRLLVKLYKRN